MEPTPATPLYTGEPQTEESKKARYIKYAVSTLIGVAVLGALGIGLRYYSQNTPPPTAPVEEAPVTFTANSYSALVESADAQEIVLTKEDGTTETFAPNDFIGIYDNRVRDAMKPIEAGELKKGMRVQVSTTLNSADDTKVISLTVIGAAP